MSYGKDQDSDRVSGRHYYRGQLLLEGDFLAEQNYHVDARRHHNLHLHGWGVVHGLTVSRDSDTSLAVNPGIAIDASGYEIFLERTQHVSLAEFGPNDRCRSALVMRMSPAQRVALVQHNQDATFMP